MPEKKQELTPEEEYLSELDVNPDDVLPKEDEPEDYKPLPEGFNPKDYGLPDPNEWKETRANLQTAEKRFADTQKEYHNNQTRFSQEMSAIKQQVQQMQQSPPPQYGTQIQQPMKQSDHLWRQYQQNPDVNRYNEYMATVAEEKAIAQTQKMQSEFEKRLAIERQNMAINADRMAFAQNPANRDIDVSMMESNFIPERGGMTPTYSELAMIYRARQSGGIDNYVKKVKAEGAIGYIEMAKQNAGKGQPKLPHNKGNAPNNQQYTDETDWEGMTDEQFARHIQEYQQNTGTSIVDPSVLPKL